MKFTSDQIAEICRLCGYDANKTGEPTPMQATLEKWANSVNGGRMVEIMDQIAMTKEAPPQAQPRARRRLARLISIAPGPALARA